MSGFLCSVLSFPDIFQISDASACKKWRTEKLKPFAQTNFLPFAFFGSIIAAYVFMIHSCVMLYSFQYVWFELKVGENENKIV